MPTFLIERNIPGAAQLTREQSRDVPADYQRMLGRITSNHKTRLKEAHT